MRVREVKDFLLSRGLQDRLLTFARSSATVELAAQALGVDGARIAKSMGFRLGDRTVMVVTAGDTKIDNRKYKDQFGGKAVMLTPEEAVERIGHAVGGVCPFAVNEGVEVYLDRSMQRFETVFPAAGSSNSAIELSIPELEQVSGAKGWVDISKPMEG